MVFLFLRGLFSMFNYSFKKSILLSFLFLTTTSFTHNAFMKAIIKNKVQDAQHALDAGVDVNLRFPGDCLTALSIAAYEGNINMVKLLLDYGADLEIKDNFGHTALENATHEGHTKIVKLLVAHGAQINSETVMAAIVSRKIEIIQFLFDHGANLNAHEFANALTKASFYGPVDIVKLLLVSKADVNTKDRLGHTALKTAAQQKHVEIVNLLLDHGAQIGPKEFVAGCRKLEIVQIFIDHHADINSKDDSFFDWTGLMQACDNGYEDIVQLLLKHNANVNAKDKYDRTALMISCDRGHINIAKLLLDYGADVNAQDNSGNTALINACCNHQINLAKLLLDHKANVHIKNHGGYTALSGLSMCEDNHPIIKLLIEYGADKK